MFFCGRGNEQSVKLIMYANSQIACVHTGFSQGGLIARAIIQSTNKHNVHTFISLSAPQGGQYGGMQHYVLWHECCQIIFRIAFTIRSRTG